MKKIYNNLRPSLYGDEREFILSPGLKVKIDKIQRNLNHKKLNEMGFIRSHLSKNIHTLQMYLQSIGLTYTEIKKNNLEDKIYNSQKFKNFLKDNQKTFLYNIIECSVVNCDIKRVDLPNNVLDIVNKTKTVKFSIGNNFIKHILKHKQKIKKTSIIKKDNKSSNNKTNIKSNNKSNKSNNKSNKSNKTNKKSNTSNNKIKSVKAKKKSKINKISKSIKNKTRKYRYFRNYKFKVIKLTKEKLIQKSNLKSNGLENVIEVHNKLEDRFQFYKNKNNETFILKQVRHIPRNNNYLLQSINEIFASYIVNKVFKFYSPHLNLCYLNTKDKNTKDIKNTLSKYNNYDDKNYYVLSKIEDKIGSEHFKVKKNNDADFINSFLMNCIMANWDIYVAGNMYYVNKNSNNTNKTMNDYRINFLDVGGSMIYRAMGATKDSFINNSEPNEHITLIQYNKQLFNKYDLIKLLEDSYDYLNKLSSLDTIKNKITKFINNILNIFTNFIYKTNFTNLSKKEKNKIIKDCENILETNKTHLIRRYKWYLDNKNKVLDDIKKI
jgi:hypothetical protein